jgi:hypothetical protein
MKTFWLVFVWGDIEPEAKGPFETETERDEAAFKLRDEEGDHGIFWLDVTDGAPEIGAYSEGFFDGDE